MKAMKQAALAAAAFLCLAQAAQAQWPEKPATLIVPWSAGGGTDGTARALAAALEKRLGQPFNVVNRTGGGGLVGHNALTTARPDGYTLGVVTIEITMYESQGLAGARPEDFTFIGRFNADPIGINVRKDAPYGDLAALVADLRHEGGRALTASGANRGGLSHLAWLGLLEALDIPSTKSPWVASDGSAPALQQLAAGAIDIVSTSPAEARPLVDAGEARTLALISAERSPIYPDLPSTQEILGTDWSPLPFRGLAGPAGLPEEVTTRLQDSLAEIVEDPDFKAFMTSQGFSVAYQDSARFTQTVMTARDGLAAAMRASGLGH